MLGAYTLLSVRPHYEAINPKIIAGRLRGAEIYVQAQPGLTAEWLRLELARHAVAARSTASACPSDLPATSIGVESHGPGFVVTIRAEDDAVAREIVRRARRWHRPD